MAWGKRVNGFGYGPDGAQASLTDFLGNEHRFKAISLDDRKALESYLLLFPNPMDSAVGVSCTVHPQNADQSEIRDQLEGMMEQAAAERCRLAAFGILGEIKVRLKYQPSNNRFTGALNSEDTADLPSILDRVVAQQGTLSFYCLPLLPND